MYDQTKFVYKLAIVYLLNSTSMQKKSGFDFLALSHLGRFLHGFEQALRADWNSIYMITLYLYLSPTCLGNFDVTTHF